MALVKPIEILKDVINSVDHKVTIDNVISLGGGQYKLEVENTYYLRTHKKVFIASVEYSITDFEINSYLTVKALSGDIPVSASSFSIDAPLYVYGNPKMVSAEIVKRIENSIITWPYMWVVEVSRTQRTLDPSLAVKQTPEFNIFLLDSNDKDNWTIEQHYENDIYTLLNYLDFLLKILKSRADLFETDSINFNTSNHVNFGNYIIDRGMETRILNDDVTGVQVQIDLPIVVSTCDKIDLTPSGGIDITVNGLFYKENVTEDENIEVVDTLGDPVLVQIINGKVVVDCQPVTGESFELLSGESFLLLNGEDFELLN